MALLGAQLVITLIIISLIQKLGHHFSFGRWLLCSTGLIRYLYPTDDTLRELAHIPKEKPAKRNKIYENGKQKTFHIPKDLEFELETAKISVLDVIHLKYYTEYQWLLDFAVYAAIVYTLTEVYKSFYSIENEINLSIIWCTLIVGYALKILLSLTIQYFRSDESIGERSACIVMGFIYLLIAMIFLIINENVLELGLEKAYSSFNRTASTFINTQNIKSTGPASKIVLKFFISVWCAILGTIFTFPGLRTGRMHCDLLK
ncbi:transmembrane protein 161B-like [Agrilus planipennis]|nr:transmembrane protein 161B-like [Agrilus planipennis]